MTTGPASGCAGKPLDLRNTNDPNWWVENWVGPRVLVRTVDVDEVLEAWRDRRR